jgi:hypothetical protein
MDWPCGAGLARWVGYSQWESWTVFRSTNVLRSPRFVRFVAEISTAGEEIRQVLKDAQGRYWLAATRGLLKWEQGCWTRYPSPARECVNAAVRLLSNMAQSRKLELNCAVDDVVPDRSWEPHCEFSKSC